MPRYFISLGNPFDKGKWSYIDVNTIVYVGENSHAEYAKHTTVVTENGRTYLTRDPIKHIMDAIETYTDAEVEAVSTAAITAPKE